MALPLVKSSRLPLSEDRRRYPRVRVNLLGRHMLTDRHEYPCQVTDMSQGGMNDRPGHWPDQRARDRRLRMCHRHRPAAGHRAVTIGKTPRPGGPPKTASRSNICASSIPISSKTTSPAILPLLTSYGLGLPIRRYPHF